MEKKKMKRWKKTLIWVGVAVLLLCVIGGTVFNPYFLQNKKENVPTLAYNETLTKEEALRDIDYVMFLVGKVHPACIKGMAPEFQSAYERETAKLKDEVTVNELHQAIERILASMRDGHTGAYVTEHNTRYMLYTYENRALGKRVNEINGMDMGELFEKNKDLFSFESEDYGLERMMWLLSRDDGLAFLGIDVNDGVTYTYEDENGNIEDLTYYAKDFVSYDEYDAYYNSDFGNDGGASFVYYEIDKENSLGILTLTSCRNNSEYKSTVKDFFTEVKENGIENIAVDIRDNGGGNSSVINHFYRYLDIDGFYTEGSKIRVGPLMFGSDKPCYNKNNRFDELTFKGDLYILTSNVSFSSAMMFAEYTKDNGIGKIVGVAPGNDPSGYGDIAIFMTPNAHIYFSVSIKDFTRVDNSKVGELVMPDIPCESADALDKVYEIVK